MTSGKTSINHSCKILIFFLTGPPPDGRVRAMPCLRRASICDLYACAVAITGLCGKGGAVNKIPMELLSVDVIPDLRARLRYFAFQLSGIISVIASPPSLSAVRSPFIFLMSVFAMYSPNPLPSVLLSAHALPR